MVHIFQLMYRRQRQHPIEIEKAINCKMFLASVILIWNSVTSWQDGRGLLMMIVYLKTDCSIMILLFQRENTTWLMLVIITPTIYYALTEVYAIISRSKYQPRKNHVPKKSFSIYDIPVYEMLLNVFLE